MADSDATEDERRGTCLPRGFMHVLVLGCDFAWRASNLLERHPHHSPLVTTLTTATPSNFFFTLLL